MPRMFDILRGKVPEDLNLSKPDVRNKNSLSFYVSEIKARKHTDSGVRQENAIQATKRLLNEVKKKNIDSREVSREIYEQAVKVAEELLDRLSKHEELDSYVEVIYQTIDVLINQLMLGNSLLENIARDYPREGYLSNHLINVCILSLATAMQMKLNKSKLSILGAAAFLHDVGMLDFTDIISQPRKLSTDEFNRVKSHVSQSIKLLSTTQIAHGLIKEIIKRHHERLNGEGYPLGLKHGQIDEDAQILGLVDTYEAITHSRSYHKTKIPHQAIKELLSNLKFSFDSRVIKAFVDKISLYPIGTLVRLNNGDIAKIVSSNPDLPLHPVVVVVMDSFGKKITEPAILDLSRDESIYIKEPYSLNSN